MSTALEAIAGSTGVKPEEVAEVLRGMIISSKNQHGATATNAEMTVVSSIFAKYDLNPFIREGHAFISGGKLQVMIGIDGWLKIMNRHPDFDGVEFDYEWDGKTLSGVTTKIFTKNRSRPVCVTEWLDECKQDKSDAWRKYPKRMLRNKSIGQCVRVAFGISEIIDNDEAERMGVKSEREVTQSPQAPNADYTAIESAMAECGDHEGLNAVCAGIRTEMEKLAIWDTEKVVLAGMKATHKARIDSYTPVSSASEFDEPEVTTASVTEDDDVTFE